MKLNLADIATSFPDTVIDNRFFGDGLAKTQNKMFMGTQLRRHISNQQEAAELIVQAGEQILDRHTRASMPSIDLLLTNVSVPDEIFTGCGAVVAKRLGIKPNWIYDLHNTGCVSFLYMIDLAQSLMATKRIRTALICNAQTAGGRIFARDGVRKKAQAAIPGDGAAVAFLSADRGAEIMASSLQTFHNYAEDMFLSHDDGRRYWEPGTSDAYIDFNEAKTAKILTRGNRLVPEMVFEVCNKVGIKASDIDYLITNQPNRHFLRNWREALQIPEERHLDTFDQYANLFGAGIPVTLSEATVAGKIQKDQMVCLAGFSHAGDYAGATLLRWA
jgi:3-oxoacyl-[acyl-carrier-protein] synthase-3